ncbi:carph-isopro domain-containing protein [Sphingomonas sp. FUKUSWIS1]|uniref:carph-isopro domain-containing protein n=1 Tax=Sphingomonas sp. FUKUSWIS1 TaxID=1379701 RepID=UPI003FA782F6
MIAAIGGVRKTAAALGIAPTTVQHWKSHNRVPAWRQNDLTAVYNHAVEKKEAA